VDTARLSIDLVGEMSDRAVIFLRLLGGLAVLYPTGCTQEVVPLSCTITPPVRCDDPPPRYADVAPIIEARCAGPCHSGVPDGPWPLTDYSHVADWQDVVRADLLDCSMPPPGEGVVMPDAERTVILSWIRCGSLP
jgi:hypothetical protein